MSNETKQDVFEEFADECAGLNDEIYKQYMQRYDAALPDDLPVIPRAVADWIEHCKNRNYSLWVALFDFQGDSKIDRWFNDNGLRSIRTQRQDIFARAWLDGYTVEED
ncbi:DUF1642 domain-containing protein [Lapidilactobacillus mulanensis]|uniref:DUF1642 domain-containing protein n=1 Tax=Lapidilactobacillus mulanensis TaxID=2485999 RepID=A0ABW4DSN8_9LACO|nr:DUF1642 domain-containing protein [Lapidilactobacillus mulanensis]